MSDHYNLRSARIVSSALLLEDEDHLPDDDKSDASESDTLSIDDDTDSEFSGIEEGERTDAIFPRIWKLKPK